MRVKIGDTWFDPCDVAICIELNPKDREQINAMDKDKSKWAMMPESFTSGKTREELFAWME